MNEYIKILERIYSLPSSVLKIGLSNTLTLSESLGSPQKMYKIIHVAGTNGKGSVTTKIAEGLVLAGYKVGKFISPHITSYRERISINGQLISQEDVAFGMNMLFHLQEQLSLSLSFFELTTLLAFWYFAREKVDFAVVETGLGGRLDATNIVDPILSVITSISKDHEKILGHTLQEIAEQKAGIIKPLVPVVIGPKAHCEAIKDRAKSLSSELVEAESVGGFFDRQNQEIAKTALQMISDKYPLTEYSISEGILKRPQCRFEIIEHNHEIFRDRKNKPRAVVFDVAHNPEAMRHLLSALEEFFPKCNYHVVLGLSKDKEIDLCTKVVSSFAHHLYLVKADSDRAETVQSLHDSFFRNGYQNTEECQSVEDGMSKALNASSDEDVIVVCGTFFIMREARAFLGIDEPAD